MEPTRPQLGHVTEEPLPQELEQRFRIGRRLGAGSSALVHQAWDLQADREVALKVMRQALVDHPARQKRFIRGLQALERLRHPHVQPLQAQLQLGDGRVVGVMPLARSTLEMAMKGLEPPSPQRVLAWGAQLAGALVHLRRHGIIHRDIKPANVLVSQQGAVWLADFGSCFDTRGPPPPDRPLGTPRFMAPEQRLCPQEPSPQWDQYALGATLCWCLQVLEAEVPEPLLRATRPAAEDRYPTPEELVSSLAALTAPS